MLHDPEQSAILTRLRKRDYTDIRINAGPGTGKTTLIIQAVADAIDAGVNPATIRVVTFSRRQAAELTERLKTINAIRFDYSETAYRNVWCGTCHSLAYEIVIANAKALGIRLPLLVYANPSEDRCENPFTAGWREARAQDKKSPGTLDRFYTAMEGQGAITYERLIAKAIASRRFVDFHLQQIARCFFLCVDEIQDFDRDEADLLGLLDAERCLWVGDRNQSIYEWRGASPYLLDMEVDAEYTLARNYRSVPAIVDAANRFIGTDQTTDRSGILEPTIQACEDAAFETDYLAIWAAQHEEEGTVAILTRTNRYADSIRDTLRQRHIECSGDEMKLADEPWFRRFMSALRLAINPTLNIEAAALFGATDTEKQHAMMGGKYLYEIICNARFNGDPMLRMQAMALGWRVDWLVRFAQDNDPVVRPYDIERILDLFHKSNAATLAEFLRYLEETIRDGAVTHDPQTVLVATVHQAKGMEFDAVVIAAGCVDGQFPIISGRANPDEERRIFYTALTRARNHLLITVPRVRVDTITAAPSPYLQGIIETDIPTVSRPDAQLTRKAAASGRGDGEKE